MASTTNPKQMTPKQPSEYLDYDFDWTRRLAPSADTLKTGLVTCDNPDLDIGATEVSTTVVKQWVGGGEAGTTYHLTCIVTTDGGRTLEADMYIKVKEL